MKPGINHKGGRYAVVVEFDMPTIPPTRPHLREYIKEALESWGYHNRKNDVLALSLGQVSVKQIERK